MAPAQPGSTYSATFLAVPAGTYTATAQNVDNAGNLVGTAVTSQPFAVVDLPTTQTYDVPQQVTLSFAQ